MFPHPPRPLRLFLLLAVACLAVGLPVRAQDPGSMASKVTRPATCGDAQILKYNATSGLFECQDEGAGGGSGDNISVAGVAAADANFINSARISFTLNATPTPDEITADILANAVGPAQIDETANYAFTGGIFGTGVLTCGAGTAGRARVHTTPLQYCDNTATPALRYAAYGDSSGNALSGDSATAFFSTGTVEVARLPNLESLNGLLDVPSGGTGSAPAAGDQLLVSDSASAATWRTLPGCSAGATDKLLYDAATNTFSCGADQNSGGAPAWENLINGTNAATTFTADSTAETMTYSFESAFTTGSQFLIRQQTGNPTGGNLAGISLADADVTGLRISNAATPGLPAWNLYSGEADSSFSALLQGYLQGAFNAFAKLNGATASKDVALTAVMQDDSLNPIFGFYNVAQSTNTSGTKNGTFALEGDAYHSGAGDNSLVTGVAGFAGMTGAGTVTNLASLFGYTNSRSAGTVTNNYGLLLQSQVGVGTNNFAILTQGGTVQHNTGDASTVGLLVRGAGSQAANLTEWQDSGLSVVASVSPSGIINTTGGFQVNGSALNFSHLAGTVSDAQIAAGAVDGGTGGEIQDGTITSADLATANKTFQITYTFFDPAADLPATLDVPSIYANRARAVHLTEVFCEINAGSASINLQRDDGTPANVLSSDLACSTAGATSTGFAAGEDALAVGQKLDHVTVSVGAGLRRLNVVLTYTVD